MEIFIAPKFSRAFKRLPKILKNKAEEKEKIFRINPFDPRLETHQLHGKYKKFWSFSINKDCRIMFKFGTSINKVIFINVGTHEIYKWNQA